jgi:chromosome segregation ATPase
MILPADERFAMTTLRDMIANLQAHIDHRAAEIATPRITATEETAAARVGAAEQERDQYQRRFEDLQEEVCRQRDVWERQRDRLRAEITELRAVKP